ncbi:MAG: MoaD/ThiS family protein [Mycobacteriales bacterium]
MTVTIRLWAAAREAAGRSAATANAGRLTDILATLGSDPTLLRVLGVCAILVDGERCGPDALVADGSVVEVLPPFAGG